MLTVVVGLFGWLLSSWSSASFRQRRVEAVKERLKSASPQKRAAKERLNSTEKASPQERAAKSSDGRTLPLFERASAMAVVDIIVKTAGLYMFCGPKGDGKSSLMEQVAEKYPFVIHVDLQNGSMDKAVRAVAAAMGYSLDYTAEEAGCKGCGLRGA